MYVEISREALLRPLQLVNSAISSRPVQPILSNVLMAVENGILTLTGTDMELELVGTLAVENYRPGRTTVPARKLFDLCRGLPEGSILKLECEDNRLTLRSGRSRFNLATLPANEYPNIEGWESLLELTLPQAELKRLIEATQFSMANQDVRYYLNGMLFETEGTCLRTVATDGHRLATCVRELFPEPLPQQQAILPRKGVLELTRLLEGGDKPVTLQIGRSNLRVLLDGFIYTSKLVDGRFPDWRRVMPQASSKIVLVERDALKQSCARVAIFANEKFRGVRLNLQSGLLRLSASNPDQEEAEEILDVNYEGHDLEIGFNVAYVLDVLNALKCPQIQFGLGDSISSAVITAADNRDAQYVIMPMRI